MERSRTVDPTSTERDVLRVVDALMMEAKRSGRTIRLVGIKLSRFVSAKQMELFEQHRRLGQTMDGIRGRYGYGKVALATGLQGDPATEPVSARREVSEVNR